LTFRRIRWIYIHIIPTPESLAAWDIGSNHSDD
jgi:hypothetical protein